MSHFKFAGLDINRNQLWWFYRDWTYTTQHWISTELMNRYVVDVSCRTPMGTYVPRYRMWFQFNPQTSAD